MSSGKRFLSLLRKLLDQKSSVSLWDSNAECLLWSGKAACRPVLSALVRVFSFACLTFIFPLLITRLLSLTGASISKERKVCVNLYPFPYVVLHLLQFFWCDNNMQEVCFSVIFNMIYLWVYLASCFPSGRSYLKRSVSLAGWPVVLCFHPNHVLRMKGAWPGTASGKLGGMDTYP